jgi:lysophospholipid acyltransferase (LPLAT)-like uncharacterized protein
VVHEFIEMIPERIGGDTSARLPLRVRWKRAKRKLGRQVALWIGPALLRALASTWRITLIGEENVGSSDADGQIIAIWHGRLLVPMPYHAHRDWSILVSRSGDGDLTSTVLERFGYRLIRGSSSRGGAQALREMVQALRGGSVLVMTPDGPRGPRHAINPGLVWIARATGYPILPCGAVCDRAWRMKSWDRFTIPKPGARVVFVYGTPMRIGREMKGAELDAATDKLRAMMIDSEERGFAQLNEAPDW